MYRVSLLFAILLTPMGSWVQSDGSQVTMACPGTEHFTERSIKLPSGCVSYAAGVWMTVERFTALKSEGAAAKAEAQSLRDSLEVTSKARQSDTAKSAGALQKCVLELQSGLDEILRLNRARWSLGQLSTGFMAGALSCGVLVYSVGE